VKINRLLRQTSVVKFTGMLLANQPRQCLFSMFLPYDFDPAPGEPGFFANGMSALGQKQTHAAHTSMSGKCHKQTFMSSNCGQPRFRNSFSSWAERVAKNDDALHTIHFRAW
jgi:hypothetical protein